MSFQDTRAKFHAANGFGCSARTWGESKKSTVHGRVTLSRAAYAEANGDFAIVLVGRLVPPYLDDQIDHSDPTDDEPTDITTRTSVLHVAIRAIWLVSPERGDVLSKSLHLSK